MSIWGPLLSAGGSFLGGILGGGSSTNPYQGLYDQAGQYSDELRQLLKQRFSAAEGILADRTKQVMGDFARAESSIKTIGRQGRKDILNREKQGVAAANASMQKRGLYQTTATDGVQRGVRADTTRSLNRFNESIGSLQAQAAARTGAARTGLLGSEASIQTQRFGAESNTLQTLIAQLLNQSNQGTQSWQAGRAAGAASGSKLGGQIGGMIPGLIGSLFG